MNCLDSPLQYNLDMVSWSHWSSFIFERPIKLPTSYLTQFIGFIDLYPSEIEEHVQALCTTLFEHEIVIALDIVEDRELRHGTRNAHIVWSRRSTLGMQRKNVLTEDLTRFSKSHVSARRSSPVPLQMELDYRENKGWGSSVWRGMRCDVCAIFNESSSFCVNGSSSLFFFSTEFWLFNPPCKTLRTRERKIRY